MVQEATNIVELISILFTVLYFLLILYFILKGNVKIANAMTLVNMAFYPLTFGLIYLYAYPKNIVVGNITPQIPLTITVILVLLAAITFIPMKTQRTLVKYQSILTGIGLVALGLGIYFIGIICSIICIYAPEIFGFRFQMPFQGVMIHLIALVICSLVLFYSTLKEHTQYPNVIRKVIQTLIIIVSTPTIIISLILIYAMPDAPLKSYPFAASINLLGFLFWGGLLTVMQRSYYNKDNVAVPEIPDNDKM